MEKELQKFTWREMKGLRKSSKEIIIKEIEEDKAKKEKMLRDLQAEIARKEELIKLLKL